MPEESAPEPAAEESLAESFWMVARRLRHATREALAPWDVTPSQARALGVLRRRRDLRAGELAEQLHIVPRSVTEVVDDLVDRHLVERHPDPHDRRATLVRLTDEGTRVADAVATARATRAEALFASLTATDRAHLTRILKDLRD